MATYDFELKITKHVEGKEDVISAFPTVKEIEEENLTIVIMMALDEARDAIDKRERKGGLV